MQLKTNSPEETFALAGKIAAVLENGSVICLKGDLGAGKTLFVQGVAAALAVNDEVTSPTFSLMNIYEGKLPLYHFDLYRLDYAEQLQDIGFYEYSTLDEGIVLIEWPDSFMEEMPENYLMLTIERGSEEAERIITIEAVGKKYEEVINKCQF